MQQGCRIAPYRTFRVARLEALLSLQPGAENRRQALDQLGHELAAEITWVDPRNACLSLAVGPSAMAVQVLLELRGPVSGDSEKWRRTNSGCRLTPGSAGPDGEQP